MPRTATIRDLRTRFPLLKEIIEREGEVVVTDHGRAAYVLRRFRPPSKAPPEPVDDYARLVRRMPEPMTPKATKALHDADRDER